VPQITAFTNVASVYRTVGWGIRITSDLALTAASGHVWVAAIPLNLSTTFPYYDAPISEAGMASVPLSEKFSVVELAERPLIVPGKAFDDAVYRFRTTSSNETQTTAVGTESTMGWCSIVVMAVGLPVSTANSLNVEFIQHVEYIQDGSPLYGFIDTMPGVYDFNEIQAASRVETASSVGYIESVVSTLESASEAAMSAMSVSSRVVKALGPISKLAGNLYKARGFFRAPGTSPFAQIEYKEY